MSEEETDNTVEVTVGTPDDPDLPTPTDVAPSDKRERRAIEMRCASRSSTTP